MDIAEKTTDLDGACIPAVETEMSRRYLRIAHAWVPTAVSYFADWPQRPNCGHFFGGVHWYGIETAVPLHALATLSTSPEYDAAATGVSLEELRAMVLKAVRYLCFVHDTGPEDCLRPDKGLGMPRSWGTKWGERGRGFFPESQCGGTIANMTTSALMLRPYIDDETWSMLACICIDYLERFGDMAPKDGVYANTQMEENAWTAHGLAACYLFLSRHEDARKWEQGAKRWMFSACAAPQDRFDQVEIEPGRTAAQLTGQTFTTLPDFMAENHGMVHPGYTASGVMSAANLGTLYRLYGRIEPPHAHWNRQTIYDVIKQLTDLAAAPMATQGMDRLYFTERHALHAGAYLFLNDPDAGYFERVALEIREKTQQGNGGRLIDPEIAKKCHEVEDPMEIKESEMISGIVNPYLMHRLMDSQAPEPTSGDRIATRFQGTRVFPHSGFAFHRHARGQTSLAWRNHILALVYPRDGALTVGPSRTSLLGQVEVRGHPASQKELAVSVDRKDDGFAALMVFDRAQGAVRQRVLFASLPNGDVLSCESLVAQESCTVERVQQGFIRVINENWPHYDGNCNGRRVLTYPDGERTFDGFPSLDKKDDVTVDLDHPRWLNIDDRVGLVFSGTGRTQYLNRHYYPPFSFRAVADDLLLSLEDQPRDVKPGDVIGALSVLVCPEQSRHDTPGRTLIEPDSSPDSACLIADGYLCAGNFGARRTVCAFSSSIDGPVRVFPGTTTLRGNNVEYRILLQAQQAIYLEEVFQIETDGRITVDTVDTGFAYITNESDTATTAKVIQDDKTTDIPLQPDETKVVQ